MNNISDTHLQIQLLKNGDPGINDQLRIEMIRTISHAYLHPDKVIDRRFHTSDCILLLRNKGLLAGFSTFCRTRLELDNGFLRTFYLGIMAASPTIQGKGLILRVMDAMVEEIRKACGCGCGSGSECENENQNEENGGSTLIWCTTASPGIVRIFRKYFADVSPDEDGNIRPEHRAVERAMRRYLCGRETGPDDMPLVLRGLLPASAYSPEETARLELLHRHQPGNLIKRMDIDHQRGDRLILIGSVMYPAETRFIASLQRNRCRGSSRETR